MDLLEWTRIYLRNKPPTSRIHKAENYQMALTFYGVLKQTYRIILTGTERQSVVVLVSESRFLLVSSALASFCDYPSLLPIPARFTPFTLCGTSDSPCKWQLQLSANSAQDLSCKSPNSAATPW